MRDPIRPEPLPPTPTLTTARLVLRPLEERDAPAIQRIFPQWKLVQYLNPAIPWPYPEDGAATNVADCLARRARGEKFFWAITLKRSDELRGRIDLWPDDGESRDMRGFWLDPELWGRGIMTEAANRVTRYAFEELGWPHLWLSNDTRNTGSHRVKEKQGAEIVDYTDRDSLAGPGKRVTWILRRDAWLAARARA